MTKTQSPEWIRARCECANVRMCRWFDTNTHWYTPAIALRTQSKKIDPVADQHRKNQHTHTSKRLLSQCTNYMNERISNATLGCCNVSDQAKHVARCVSSSYTFFALLLFCCWCCCCVHCYWWHFQVQIGDSDDMIVIPVESIRCDYLHYTECVCVCAHGSLWMLHKDA